MTKCKYKVAWDENYKGSQGQKFDRKTITIKRYGKEVNLYDLIQENKGDSDIEECLKKYGTLQPITLNIPETYGEIKETLTLADSLNLDIKLKEIYDSLPTEVKDEFGNNFYNFKDNGLEYFEKGMKKYEEQRNNNAPVPTDETSTGEQTKPNETK